MYKCPSYYDNDNILQNCECGECGTAGFNDIHYKNRPVEIIEPIVSQAQIEEEKMQINSEAIMDRILRSDKWDKSN